MTKIGMPDQRNLIEVNTSEGGVVKISFEITVSESPKSVISGKNKKREIGTQTDVVEVQPSPKREVSLKDGKLTVTVLKTERAPPALPKRTRATRESLNRGALSSALKVRLTAEGREPFIQKQLRRPRPE